MTKFSQKKNIFLIEYKYIWFFRYKNIENKNVFLQHFSNHRYVALKDLRYVKINSVNLV